MLALFVNTAFLLWSFLCLLLEVHASWTLECDASSDFAVYPSPLHVLVVLFALVGFVTVLAVFIYDVVAPPSPPPRSEHEAAWWRGCRQTRVGAYGLLLVLLALRLRASVVCRPLDVVRRARAVRVPRRLPGARRLVRDADCGRRGGGPLLRRLLLLLGPPPDNDRRAGGGESVAPQREMSREEEAMRYPAYPAITPRITQRSPSREGPRAGLETRERSDEEKMAFSGGARWLKISRERSEAEEKNWRRFGGQMARLAPHIYTPQRRRCGLPPIAQRLPQGDAPVTLAGLKGRRNE